MSESIRPAELAALQGEDSFSFGAKVSDFWRWSMGDLRMNTTRGFLVEFLVAHAVGSKAAHRVEWAPFDVEAADGTKLEVKATAYLQSWTSKRLSIPSWSFPSLLKESAWDEALGLDVPVDPATRVDAWVLALHTCQLPDDYNPLDIEQWEFRVVPHRALLALAQRSVRISTLTRIGVSSVSFEGLPDAVAAARAANDELA